MTKSALFLSTVMALGAAPGAATLAAVATAQETAPARPAEAKPAPSPAPPEAAPTPAPTAPDKAARSKGTLPTDPAKRPPRTLRMIVAEFRALDLDKKTVTFETDDGKSHTVEAQVPTMPEAVDRAAHLAQVLKPGDRIRMLCKVTPDQEPTLILSLHMVSPTAPMQYR
jgi:hypothetical protein